MEKCSHDLWEPPVSADPRSAGETAAFSKDETEMGCIPSLRLCDRHPSCSTHAERPEQECMVLRAGARQLLRASWRTAAHHSQPLLHLYYTFSEWLRSLRLVLGSSAVWRSAFAGGTGKISQPCLDGFGPHQII